MNAKIVTFSRHGDSTLLEYDPETADMDLDDWLRAEAEIAAKNAKTAAL